MDLVTGVADSCFAELIAALEQGEIDRTYLLATREDNAIALACGASLAGRQTLVFMESSGVGNALDALTSLAAVYEMPLVLLIAWAGYKNRDVPHHNAIGDGLDGALSALGIPVLQVRLGVPFRDVCSVIAEAVDLARTKMRPVAILGIPEDLSNEEWNPA